MKIIERWLLFRYIEGQFTPLSKARVRNMDLRYVEEADPTRQALLEIYASVVLRTMYNDFDTH
jgi:hypothetical protein